MTYKNVDGWVVPAADEVCAQAALQQVADLKSYYPFVTAFDVAVQAGGNIGVWPAKMAERFKFVYTFEPDADNFNCLSHNAMLSNIIKFQAALGERHECIKMWTNPANVGAHYVDGTGEIPTIRIDDLNLPVCNMIMLDVEGYETAALKGGEETIKKFRPCIVVEEKGHHRRFKAEPPVEYLATLGYRQVAWIGRDIVYTWR